MISIRRKLTTVLLILLSMKATQVVAQDTTSYNTAAIYYNEACTMCAMYIKQELIPTLEKVGIANIIKKDYVNKKQNRIELNDLNRQYTIPPNLQGHFMTFMDERIVLGGHVPSHIVVDLLTQELPIEKMLVLQDEMENATSYFAWGFKGEAQEYPIDEPIQTYLDWFQEHRDSLQEPEAYEEYWSFKKLFPLVFSSGFVDGLNPCAFAVLIFFIAFLFTLNRLTSRILLVGFVYIAMIYLAYLLIGLGLVHAFIFSGQEHLMAKISAYLVIALGLVHIKDYFWYGRWFSLSFTIDYSKWMDRVTIPSVMIVGFLVGLCTFPCSGGIYVAIIGLLSAKTTYTHGLYYILFYNFMFVLPLIITLFFLTNRRTLGRISRWEASHKRVLKLITGLIMIALGIVILLWLL